MITKSGQEPVLWRHPGKSRLSLFLLAVALPGYADMVHC